MKVAVLAEDPRLLRHLDFVREHFARANLEIKARRVHTHVRSRFGRGARVAIFDNSIRASPERLGVLRAIQRSKRPVLILVRASSEDVEGWSFPDHATAFGFRALLSSQQRESFLAQLSRQ